MKPSKIALLLGLFLTLLAFVALYTGDSALAGSRQIVFTDPAGDRLDGTYYPGQREAGLIIFEGFSADQVMMRSAAVEFARAGFHVFTFDFSGQGKSPGSLGFDNAATDRLAFQSQAAMQVFMRESGLPAKRIFWLGHSLGARVALQTALLGEPLPAGLILLGAQINLGRNAQSEFFTGTSDSDLPWVQALGPQNPPVPLLLLSGDWEDILTPAGATLLMQSLCGTETTDCPGREWLLYPRLVHNYEIFSPRALSDAKAWASQRLGTNLDTTAPTAQMRLVWWFAALFGMTLTLGGTLALVKTRYPALFLRPGFNVTRPIRFLTIKLLLWLAALPLAGLLMFLFLLIPLGNPVFNLIYAGFIGGYGLLMLILYHLGRAPGAQGNLGAFFQPPTADKTRWLWAIVFNLGLFTTLTLFYHSGQGLVPPVGERLAWVFIFTPITALGFWLGALEDAALARGFPKRGNLRLLAMLVGLFPFFLRFLLLAALGSTSGMIGALVGLIILGVVLVQGEITRTLLAEGWIAAILQSLLLYLAVMPQTVLFTPFFR